MSSDIEYGVVRSARELGQLARAHRKQLNLTQEKIAGLTNVSTKFLSEFERGKDTAEIGKIIQTLETLGLELVIVPRQGKVAAALLGRWDRMMKRFGFADNEAITKPEGKQDD